MAKTWCIKDAKTRFDEFLQASLAEGPQIVAEDGVEMAALLPIEYWRRLERMPTPDLKELLLAPEARTDALVAPRIDRRRRTTASIQ